MKRKIKQCRCGHPASWHDDQGCNHGRGTVTGGCGCPRIFGKKKVAAAKDPVQVERGVARLELMIDAELLSALGDVIRGFQRLVAVLSAKTTTALVGAKNGAATSMAAVDETFFPNVLKASGEAVESPKTNGRSKLLSLDGAKIGGGERRIVAALMARGGSPIGRDELAHRALWSPTSSGFRNSLSLLRTVGFIDGSDPIGLTETGWKANVPRDEAPSVETLLEAWRGKIDGGCVRAVFDELVRAYPARVPRSELAQRAGYEETSGYRNALSILRKHRLVVGSKELSITTALAGAVGLGGSS